MAVIFIGSPEKSKKNWKDTLKGLFIINPNDLLFRILVAFIPPFTQKYQKVYVDFLGPLLGVVTLVGLLNYGCDKGSPTEAVLAFAFLMPVLTFILGKLGRSSVSFYETVALVGYLVYGHLFTLLVSFLVFDEKSNFFFFLCLVVFGGLSTLRLAVLLLGTIKLPAARLLVCSLISVMNLLFLIFLHFGYMHRTYVYKLAPG